MDMPSDFPLQDILEHIRARGAELGLRASCDEQLLEAVLEHDVRVPDADEQACLRHYEAHAGSLREGELAEARHILFALTDATPIDALRRRAEQVLGELQRGDLEFAEAARRYSNCPSARLGGNLGQLDATRCVPEFWAALREQAAPGLLPRLVRSRFGLHIVELHRFDAGRLPPFEAVRERVAEQLRRRALVGALRLYAQDLQGHAQAAG